MRHLFSAPLLTARAASYTSPATLVTFWARWCSPCWKELPELDELYRQRAGDGLDVVALTRYEEPNDVASRARQLTRDREIILEHELSFPAAIATDPSVHRGFMVRFVPSGALVDGGGTIVAYGVGVEGGCELMRRAADLLDG